MALTAGRTFMRGLSKFDINRVCIVPPIINVPRNGRMLMRVRRLCTAASLQEVTISYKRGLPQLTVPLPSRREPCLFTLQPVGQTVGHLLAMLCREDLGIDRAQVTTASGVRLASSNSIESLLCEDFRLIVNDNNYYVKTPKPERVSEDGQDRLDELRNTVNQLYVMFNVEEHQRKQERALQANLEALQQELMPLEEKRSELEQVAVRRTTALTWTGLGLMGVQFGVLARLTWWEYSWDIMEPVTYFVTYGTAMAAYAYFVLTKQEYFLPEVKDRQHLIIFHKQAKKLGLDVGQYNSLKDRINQVEVDLKRLRDPLEIHLPPSYTAKIQDLENLADKRMSRLAMFKSFLEDTSNKFKKSAT